MILVALSHIVVFLELLVRLVIIGKDIVSIETALHAEMVVGGISQCTFSISRLDDALCERYGGRYAIAAHLLHGILCVIVYVLLS